MAETIKDAEFEAFLAQVKSETPDMSVIKAGVEKFGMGFFSDSQKEAFLKAMFPAPIQKGASASEKLGFQDLNGIKNSLKAMQELCADEKSPVGNNEMKSFLTLTDPANGRNVLTTVALNTWAAEKKDKIIRDKGSKEFVALLDKQENAMIDIQNMLNNVDARTMAEAANTADASDRFGNRPIRPVTYRELAAKSPLLMDENMKRIAPELEKMNFPVLRPKETGLVKVEDKERGLAKVEDKERGVAPVEKQETAVTVNGANPVKVGNLNGDALNIDGTPKTKPEDNPDQKVANYEGDAGPDSKDGKKEHPSSLGTVREQDIIDYMFQNWFLGGVNLILDGAYKIADRGIDALCGNYENAPKSRVTATLGNGAAAASAAPAGTGRAAEAGRAATSGDNKAGLTAQIDALANQSTTGYWDVMKHFAGPHAKEYAEVFLKNIENNIGKEPKKWVCEEITLPSGEKVTPLNPDTNKEMINQLNALKRTNPRAFDEMLEALRKNPKSLADNFQLKQIRLASQLAALDYASDNLGTELEGNTKAQKKVSKNTFVKATELSSTLAQLSKNAEEEYRVKHNIPENEPLSKKQQEKVNKAVEKKFGEYLNGTIEEGKALKGLVALYDKENDADKKAKLAQDIKAQQQKLDDFYGQYLPKGKEGRGSDTSERSAPSNDDATNQPRGLKEEAVVNNQAEIVEQQQKEKMAGSQADLEGRNAENTQRHKQFNEKRSQIQGSNTSRVTQQHSPQIQSGVTSIFRPTERTTR
ncbi:MAG: hypothetical protein IKR92_01505 [Alphaproteobacteria bacterium]|nr:hypothetical protein [Alphaproteobacteria bacterium]